MAADRFDHNVELSDDAKPERVPRLEVITGVQRRQSWPDAVKERIVAESMAEGVVISDAARHHRDRVRGSGRAAQRAHRRQELATVLNALAVRR